MITYYRDPSVEVTSDAVLVEGRAYPLGELAGVWRRRGAWSWRAVASRGVWVAVLASPVLAALVGVVVALQIDTSALNRLAMITGAVILGLAVGPILDLILDQVDKTYDRGAWRHEIWVDWRGRRTLLLHTRDELRFGRIYRALQRALERR